MEVLIYTSLFAFGAVCGSGLNALAYRLEVGRDWLQARSCCPQCSHQLRWWELVPILSFLALGGRCSQCQARISWQHPLVELAAGGLIMLSFAVFGMTVGFLLAAVTSVLLLFIYVFDARTMLIPDPAVWIFNLLALGSLFVDPAYRLFSAAGDLFVLPGWWALAAGPLVALPLLVIWLGSGGRAMGFGDAKLALGLGWLLGPATGFSALVYAFWVGAAVSLGLLAAQRLWKSSSLKPVSGSTMASEAGEEELGLEPDAPLSMKSAVPFGPFLILGWLIVFFSDLTLF